jgi:citrate synthase
MLIILIKIDMSTSKLLRCRTEKEQKMDAGLEAIVVAETILSDVNGLEGRLIIRGFELDHLVATMGFEEVTALLWDGFFELDLDASELRQRLGAARVEAFDRLVVMPHVNPIETLRIGLCLAPDGEDIEQAISLVATTSVATSMVARATLGLKPIRPDPSLSQAADILTMITGHEPGPIEIRALDTYLVTVCEHGLNASTFATRVVASTRAGLPSAVIAGLSALKGPLHGGAPGPVLDMLDAIGSPENAANWIDASFARGERLMGFGHRVYRARDPRADALKRAVASLPQTSGRVSYATAIENIALSELARRYPTRKLETNVEFYTALLLEALDIPRELFTCIFACGRVCGWIAHAKEQIATNRLVRPMSVYVGPLEREAA